MKLRVTCYAGYRGEETPRLVFFGDRAVEVREVMDRWLAPDHRYFKILGSDEAVYIIRHDTLNESWELVFFNRIDSQTIDPLSFMGRESHVDHQISEADGKIRNPGLRPISKH